MKLFLRTQSSWTAVTGATGYEIGRQDSSGNYDDIASVTGTSYTDAGLADGTTFSYQVIAYDDSGESTDNPTAPATTAIKAPANVFAFALSPTSNEIVWQDASSSETDYKVQRQEGGGGGGCGGCGGSGDWTDIATVAAGTTNYVDGDASAPDGYSYRVIAENSAVASVPSAAALVGAQQCGPSPYVGVNGLSCFITAEYKGPDGHPQDGYLDFFRWDTDGPDDTESVAYSGTATSGTDYAALPSSVSFSADDDPQNVIVPVVPANGSPNVGTSVTATVTLDDHSDGVSIAPHGLQISLVNTSGNATTDADGNDELLDSSNGKQNLQQLDLTLPANAPTGAAFTLTIKPKPDTDTADLVDVWTASQLSNGATTPLLGDGTASYTWTVTADGGMPPGTLSVGAINGSKVPGDLVFYLSETDPARADGAYGARTTPATVLGPPPAPTDLAAKVTHGSGTEGVSLQWHESLEPTPDLDITGPPDFVLERATDANFTYNVKDIQISGFDSPLSYLDSLPAKYIGVGFFYRIKAVNAAGSSAWSNVATTPVEPIIVGFYGADTPFTFPNGYQGASGLEGGGNKAMMAIGNELISDGLQAKTFTSRNWRGAYNWLLSHLDLNNDGKYDPSNGDEARPVEIYGYSWGGTSALELAQYIATIEKRLGIGPLRQRGRPKKASAE